MGLHEGVVAPDFTLPGVQVKDGYARRKTYTLSEQRGHPVVLAFYPADESATCTAQLCSYSEKLADFAQLGAEVWGIGLQDLASHETFAIKEDVTLPLLSDADGRVVDAYGIRLPGLGLRRSVFLIGADGLIKWKHVALVGATFRSATSIREQLAKL
ncbi:peroxiredoxin [Labedella populi]|uniref:thioredoxin-dependent peroxiredoxin n=1 Tax=Labedella populi TaxID=2498850 RepID=A0A3S4DXG2_9MICO|nr:peroxiredoxin [Labedella populi]RWZ61512.1 peroxiredoxin [Labedella populi]